MIGTLQQTLDDMKNGVYDFTNDGECTSCGACCSNYLPVSKKEIKEIHRYIKKRHIKEQKHYIPTSKPVLDMTCPFRSEEEKKCLIYSVRPAICKDFKCDKPSKDIQLNKEMFHGRYGFCDMRREFYEQG